MPKHPAGKAPLSVHWAFVVHFRLSTNIAQGQIAGRAEHVVSGQSSHFDSLEELLETVFEIKRLLYEEGFTIAGARKHLANQNGSSGKPAAHTAATPARHEPPSRAQRKFLLDLHEHLLAALTLLERE